MELDEAYWSNLYKEGETAWDAGVITPPIKKYMDQELNKNIAILIPGGGNSHEADYLLHRGFTNITVIDISAVLCKKLETKFARFLSHGLTIVCGNFFNHVGEYDLVIEQTFFCALDPALRQQYAEQVYRLLKPGGRVAGLLFNREFEGGPPFGGSKNEYELLFKPTFIIETMNECYNSIPPRKGTELFFKLVKGVQ